MIPPDENFPAIVPDTPTKGRGKSYRTSTYYRPDHALRIKSLLDKILADEKKRGLLIPYMGSNYQNKTLLMVITHSWAYLRDYMDESGVYTKLYNETKVSTEDLGISIRYKEIDTVFAGAVFVEEKAPKETDIIPRAEETIPWKRELLAFIELSQEGLPFEKALGKGNKYSENDEIWITGVLNTDDWNWIITNDRTRLVVLKKEREDE